MEYYLSVLKNYAVFSGRARRSEYWFFSLFSVIISIAFSTLGAVTGLSIFSILGGVYGLAVFIPSIAVGVRRLHDTGRSGFWFFIGLIPLIGAIVLIVFFASDSTPGANEYGPNPKGM